MVLALIMIAASWFCTTIHVLDVPLWGWIGVVFFSLCLVAMVVQFFMRGAVLVIDGIGILDRRVSPDVILWSDIRSVGMINYRNQRWLGVEFRDAATFRSRLPARSRWLVQLNERMGFPTCNVGFAGISPGIDVVWTFLRQHHAEKLKKEDETRIL